MSAINRFLGEFSEVDYPEDGLENIYVCKCAECKSEFLGYKARHTCKICKTTYEEKLAAMTPENREKHEAEKMRLLAEAANKLNFSYRIQ